MILKNNTIWFLSCLFILLGFGKTDSANGQENPLVKAIRLFDSGNFKESELILKPLIEANPNQLMVNYYYGACRTENKHYGTNEIMYLLNGSIGESPLKTDYYLGIQYHAKKQWQNALKHYSLFQKKTNLEEQQQLGLIEKIEQCKNKVNPFVREEIKPRLQPEPPKEAAIKSKEETDVLPSPVQRKEEYDLPIAKDTNTVQPKISSVQEKKDRAEKFIKPVFQENKVEKNEAINFTVDEELSYHHFSDFRTEKAKKLYKKGREQQEELSIQLKKATQLREKYSNARAYEEKKATGKEILNTETNIYKLQSQSNKLINEARQHEINYWRTVNWEEKAAFVEKLNTAKKNTEYKASKSEKATPDSNFIVTPNKKIKAPKTFPQRATATENKLVYKIKLGSYSRGVPSHREKLFKKLAYLRKIETYTDDKNIVTYTTGNLSNYEDALKLQRQVRQEGVKDAFVVPFLNDKRISLEHAKEIELKK